MRNGASRNCSTRSCQSYCMKPKKNYYNCQFLDNYSHLLKGTVRLWTALTWILALSVSKASALTQNQTLVDNVLLDFQFFTVNLFLSMLLLILG